MWERCSSQEIIYDKIQVVKSLNDIPYEDAINDNFILISWIKNQGKNLVVHVEITVTTLNGQTSFPGDVIKIFFEDFNRNHVKLRFKQHFK